MPAMMGSLRAKLSEYPRCSSLSEMTPPRIPPMPPQSPGTAAANPTLSTDMWRACDR